MSWLPSAPSSCCHSASWYVSGAAYAACAISMMTLLMTSPCWNKEAHGQMTEISLDHIWVVPFGHTRWRHRWYLWPEHLRTLTNLPNASALKEKGKLTKVGYRACTCRKQKREESSILVAGIPLVTSNLSWKFCCLKLQPWPSAQHPLDSPTQRILSVLPEVLVLQPGYPARVPVVPWQRKGQFHFPAGWNQQKEMQFVSCFSDRDCRIKPTLLLELNKTNVMRCLYSWGQSR